MVCQNNATFWKLLRRKHWLVSSQICWYSQLSHFRRVFCVRGHRISGVSLPVSGRDPSPVTSPVRCYMHPLYTAISHKWAIERIMASFMGGQHHVISFYTCGGEQLQQLTVQKGKFTTLLSIINRIGIKNGWELTVRVTNNKPRVPDSIWV